jgi:hypothetical protein
MSILKSNKNDFNGAISGIIDATPNDRKSEMSIFDEGVPFSKSILEGYPDRQIHTAAQGQFRFQAQKHPTSLNVDYDEATPVQRTRGINPSSSSHHGNYSATSKVLLNRYNAGSGMSMTGPSTLIPTQQPLETHIPTDGGPILGKQQSHQGLGSAASRIKKQLRYNNKSGVGAPPSG